MTRAKRIEILCDEIWAWYAKNKRMLPWRDLSDKDPEDKAYKVLVSEIMLQQTQVSRVIILYKKFIQTFPHIQGLAKASNRDMLMAWRGLGYNNRALRLRDAGKAIVERGMFPREMETLQSLPGIGHYTAGAIRNFAFGIPTACMDVNIRRILHRFFVGPENADGTWKKDDAYLLRLAEEILAYAVRPSPPTPLHTMERGDASNASVGERAFPRTTESWHAALMDFGSLVCTKNNPKWHLLSPRLKSICMAYGKQITRTKKLIKKEPGRVMAGKFVPNRIFRGRIIEALRDARTKLTIEELGSQAIADWSMGDHRIWMESLIGGLKRDRMIQEIRGKFVLAE